MEISREFHARPLGSNRSNCNATGGHYNPLNQTHGAPTDKVRHLGDLGNIRADANGTATFNITGGFSLCQIYHTDILMTDSMLTFFGAYNILGRGVVVHYGTDDLGKGGFNDSLTTGHAGARAACGVM
jgi:Cu-Zn family superoxide dismutase